MGRNAQRATVNAFHLIRGFVMEASVVCILPPPPEYKL
jgi:hypothetical protein